VAFGVQKKGKNALLERFNVKGCSENRRRSPEHKLEAYEATAPTFYL
jgi:hypothetical protein